MIELTNLQKVIDQRTVLDIPALAVDAGEVAALVGPSDSGLDALLALLIGRARPTAGTVRVAGLEPVTDRRAFSQAAGVLFQEDTLYTSRSPQANLAFHARLRGLPRTRVKEVLAQVGLADHAAARLEKLSSGLRRRLTFGIAALHEPRVLLVEPFARCDEPSITLLRQLITGHAANGGCTLILADTDAYLFDLCDTIYTIDLGRIVAQRRPREVEPEPAFPFKIPVKLEGRVALVNPSDILYVVSEEGRAFLQTRDERLPTQFALAELEGRLSRSGFFRAHRGYLVNLQHVTEVIPFTRSSFSLRLNDATGTLIPLSKDAARDLRELLDY